MQSFCGIPTPLLVMAEYAQDLRSWYKLNFTSPLKLMMLMLLLRFLFPCLIVGLSLFIIISRRFLDREALRPFECGFDPIKKARSPFSIRFFVLGIVFIVFDIEIVFLISLPIISQNTQIWKFILIILIFVLFMGVGLLYEWISGNLYWRE